MDSLKDTKRYSAEKLRTLEAELKRLKAPFPHNIPELTEDEVFECEDWLNNFSLLVDRISSPQFTEELLYRLIKWEAMTRRRKKVLSRMFGRYNNLRRMREWRELIEFTGEL